MDWAKHSVTDASTSTEFDELSACMARLAAMPGGEFEEFLERLFRFRKVRTRRPPEGADQGADLIAETSAGLQVVQAKRYAGSVGVAAVQEVLGAMFFYDCIHGIVVATAPYTRAARELAAKASKISLLTTVHLEQLLVGERSFDELTSTTE